MSKVHVDILLKAKEIIRKRRQEFVCLAIRESVEESYGIDYEPDSHNYRYVHPITYKLLMFIEQYLGDCPTVETWIERKGFDIGGDFMHQYRMAWIDHMVEYWRDKK